MAASLQYSIQDAKNLDNVKILSLVGDIDESNQLILDNVMKELLSEKGIDNVVVHIKDLEYINSGVVGLFAALHGTYQEEGKDFVFAEANEHIFDIIDLVGLTTVITLFETVDEACVSFED